MVTTTKPKLMTAEELLAMPDDGYRYELVKGELVKMSPAAHTHCRQASRIDRRLGTYAEDNNLGECYVAEPGFILSRDPDHVLVPDVGYVRRERVDIVGESPGYFPGPPDIAVEVISANDRLTEVAAKTADWLEHGTRMVVVVNPRNRTVQVHTADGVVELTESDTLDCGDVVPGWSMPVSAIFS